MILSDETTKQLWESVKKSLNGKISSKMEETWFSPVEFSGLEDLEGGRILRLAVPTNMHRDWLKNNLMEQINFEVTRVFGGALQNDFLVTNASVPQSPQIYEIASSQAASQNENLKRDFLH